MPANIELNAIDRGDYIKKHMTEFANDPYNPDIDIPKPIVYIDGTYEYIEK